MNKILPTILAFLFAVLFTVFGFSAGLEPLAEIGGKWKSSRSFVQVPAQVTSAELKETRHKKGFSYTTKASFQYEFEGNQYSGDQVTHNYAPDEVKKVIHKQLSQAKLLRTPVQLWVNPKYPAESVYDRDVYVGEIMLHLTLGTVFLVIGWGAFAGIVYVCYPRTRTTRPEKTQTALAARLSEHGLGGGGTLIFALVWNAVWWPICAFAWEQRGDWLGTLFTILFCACFLGFGLLFLVGAFFALRQEWLIGKPILEISSFDPLRGEFRFHPALGERLSPSELSHRVIIEAKLVTAKSRSSATEDARLWKERLSDQQVARGTERLSLEVTALPNEAETHLHITLRVAGFDHEFRVPRAEASPAK